MTGKVSGEQHRLSLRTFLYSFGLLWFLSGLLALQSALVLTNDPEHATYQAAAVLQDRQSVQPGEPAGRTQNGTVTAPVRAILTPVLYFSSKALPFSGDGAFLVAAIFTFLAAFAPSCFARNLNNPALQAYKSALRARAPPAKILA